MPIGANIKRIRKLKGIKVSALSENTGINAESIYAWERGDYNPSEENLHKLASAMKIQIKDFYDEEGTSVQQTPNNKENGMNQRETFYQDLIENNDEYSILPRAVLKDYKIVPDKIIDVIISSNENEKRALKESKEMEIESLNKKYELIIEGLENKVIRLEGDKKKLENDIEDLRRKIPANKE